MMVKLKIVHKDGSTSEYDCNKLTLSDEFVHKSLMIDHDNGRRRNFERCSATHSLEIDFGEKPNG